MNLKKLSIIIVNYKVKFFLEQSLLSVRKALKGIDGEIFVVDNNSMDDSIDYLQPLFPEVHFIRNKENVGFAKANNQAITLSNAQYILLLNPDTLVSEDTLTEVLNFMDKNPKAGGVGVKMINGKGSFLPESKRSMPTPWVSFCKIFGLTKLFPHSPFFAKYNLGFLSEDEVHPIDVLAGAFMMLRAETLQKVGLLDESFFMYGEDIDLSYRITQAGYLNYYLPIKILHYKGESTPKHTIKYVKIFYQAMDIFFKKHNPHISLFYTVVIRMAIVMRAIMAGLYRIGLWILKPFAFQSGEKRKNVLICASEKDISHIKSHLNANDHFEINTYSSSRVLPEDIRSMVREKKISEIVLSDSLLQYKEMLSLMEKLNHENIDFCIHTQESQTLVSSNQNYKL